MTDKIKVASLKDLRLGVEMDRHNLSDAEVELAALDAALDAAIAAFSRQDAQPAQHGEVDFYVCTNCGAYYRDSPVSECDCEVGARDFRHVRMAPVTQPEQQGAGAVPLSVFSEGLWVFRETGQEFSGKDLDAAAAAAYAVYRDALAARQSVGQEPVAWMDPDGSRVLTAKAKADASSAYRTATAGYSVPLYAAPPAQVDLINAVRQIEAAWRAVSGYPDTESDRDSIEDAISFASALIDQQVESAPPAQMDLSKYRGP